MVSSTATPNAIEAMMLVPKFSSAPVKPINPKNTKSGKTFGTIAMSPTRIERNIVAMRTKMIPAVSARL
jgi:hypothetical protein